MLQGTKVACSAGKTVHLYTLEGPNPEENACVFPPVEGGVVTGVRFTRKDNIIYSFYGGINVAPAEPDTQATTMPLKTCVECLDASPDNDWCAAPDAVSAGWMELGCSCHRKESVPGPLKKRAPPAQASLA